MRESVLIIFYLVELKRIHITLYSLTPHTSDWMSVVPTLIQALPRCLLLLKTLPLTPWCEIGADQFTTVPSQPCVLLYLSSCNTLPAIHGHFLNCTWIYGSNWKYKRDLCFILCPLLISGNWSHQISPLGYSSSRSTSTAWCWWHP